MYVFNLHHIEYSIVVNYFRQLLPGIIANFCSNNSDGRIWAFCSTYLTLDRDNPRIGLIHFKKKKLLFYTSRMADYKIIYEGLDGGGGGGWYSLFIKTLAHYSSH